MFQLSSNCTVQQLVCRIQNRMTRNQRILSAYQKTGQGQYYKQNNQCKISRNYQMNNPDQVIQGNSRQTCNYLQNSKNSRHSKNHYLHQSCYSPQKFFDIFPEQEKVRIPHRHYEGSQMKKLLYESEYPQRRPARPNSHINYDAQYRNHERIYQQAKPLSKSRKIYQSKIRKLVEKDRLSGKKYPKFDI